MSRFGLKIVAAMLLLAVIPLVTSIYLVGQVIRASDSIAEGQLRRLSEPLSQSADAYRQLFSATKQVFKLQARLIAADRKLTAAVVDKRMSSNERRAHLDKRLAELAKTHHGVGMLEVLDGKGQELAVLRRGGFSKTEYRSLGVELPLSGGPARVRMRFYTSRAPFIHFQRLGKSRDMALEVSQLRGDLERVFRRVFLIMFGAVVTVAMGIGFLMARRTTRRLSVLVRATRRVGEGDLTTQVHLDVRDEVRELADAFNEMVAELRENREKIGYLEKIGAWQEIARRLAHEIKNPLTPIQLAAQQLHSKYAGDDPKFRRLLDDAYDIISEEVDGLRRLVTAFSAFAKLPTVKPESVPLSNLIEDFVKSHVELIERCDWHVEPVKDDCLVMVDRMLFKHVLVNLVENAVQAAEQAKLGRAVKVEVTVVPAITPNAAQLTVTDDGPGMNPETAARAFDPYYTTKEHGTGLGLAIVKKIILEHKGTIFVEPVEGGGTRFVLRIPRVEPEQPKLSASRRLRGIVLPPRS
jgi:two-component system nitrogen regulation sensor histidine kinase NtrY